MTHTELNQVIREYMRELYEMEFIGEIKIEDLDPVGYKVSLYTTRGSENPVVLIADLEDSEFLPFIREELRSRKLHKTKYFATIKTTVDCETTCQMYPAVGNNYKTEVSAPSLFLYFKNKSITIPFHSKGILIPVISNTYWDVINVETEDYILEYEGNGSGYIKLIPKAGCEFDKEYEITLQSKYENITAVLKIYQIGLYHSFRVLEGDFLLVGEQQYFVKKNGVLE